MSEDIQYEKDTIQRCPHDSENPYSLILNEILRHKSLSIESIWLLSYLLSNDRSWKIKTSQILFHLKGRMGRKKTYDAINELIEHGYMKKIDIFNGNLKAGIRYFISEKPKFLEENSKNSSDVPIFGMPKSGKHKNKQDSLRESKKQQQKKVASAPVVVFSDEEEAADKAANQFILSELSKGHKINETAIRRKALKEKWKPNPEKSKSIDLIKNFDDGKSYKGLFSIKFECVRNNQVFGFLHPSGREYFIEMKDPSFNLKFEELIKKLGIKFIE